MVVWDWIKLVRLSLSGDGMCTVCVVDKLEWIGIDMVVVAGISANSVPVVSTRTMVVISILFFAEIIDSQVVQ